VDESLVSGEAEPVVKGVGSTVLSGSFVVAGSARCEATAVGASAYARKLADEVRRFELVHSELRAGIDRILRLITWLLVPVAALLVTTQIVTHASLPEALRASVAGVGAMIPEGLVLLTSIAFAVGATRLSRRRVLVQELAAIEGLARVDVLCIDKTGTITEPDLAVAAIEMLDPAPEAVATARDALGAIAASDPAPNRTLRAIADAVASPGWICENAIAFSSERKWSGAVFAGVGGFALGAPEVVLATAAPSTRALAEKEAAAGHRVLALSRLAPGNTADPGGEPLALVVLEERIRADAAATLGYFADQGVQVKVLSGDHPATVGAVASRVGLGDAAAAADARHLPADADGLGVAVEAGSVFGRVDPHRKREIVRALKARGHVVAMIGDGVNDVLALKDCDLGIAMGSGTAAARGVARIVMLDDRFATLPDVINEGRRVIANVERVANLFLTKTVYAFVLAVAVGVARLPFPFLPRHLTIVSSLTIGMPGFFLALAPNAARAKPGFVGRVLRFALPAGTAAAAGTFGAYAMARNAPGTTPTETRTVATIVLLSAGLWILSILARPFTPQRFVLVGTMAVAFVVVLAVPAMRSFFALELPSVTVLLATWGVVSLELLLLEGGWRVSHHRGLPWVRDGV
jgi:cation-transporting ATPase E